MARSIKYKIHVNVVNDGGVLAVVISRNSTTGDDLDFGNSYKAAKTSVSFRTIYDEEDVYYTPVAAFNISAFRSDSHFFDIKRINFDTDEEYQSYLDEMTELSAWKPKVDVTTEDRLLVLMTCSYIYDYGRLLVVCRQLREDETPESVEALYSVNE